MHLVAAVVKEAENGSTGSNEAFTVNVLMSEEDVDSSFVAFPFDDSLEEVPQESRAKRIVFVLLLCK